MVPRMYRIVCAECGRHFAFGLRPEPEARCPECSPVDAGLLAYSMLAQKAAALGGALKGLDSG